MEKSSFFGSVSGDRKYSAADMAEHFAGVIGNGVFAAEGDGLLVEPLSGMNVVLKIGKAWINGYSYRNDSDMTVTLPVSHSSLKRIDYIVLRWSLLDRSITAQVKSSEFGMTPTFPALQRDGEVYEIAIARINVPAAASTITSGMITDTRYDSSLCGTVTKRYDNMLSGFWLQNQPISFTGSECRIDNAGITDTSVAEVYFTSDSYTAAAAAAITVDTYSGYLILTAETTPTGVLYANIRIEEVG